MSGKFQGQPPTTPTFHCLKSSSAVPQYFFLAGDVSLSMRMTLGSPTRTTMGQEGAKKTMLGIGGGAMTTDKCPNLGSISSLGWQPLHPSVLTGEPTTATAQDGGHQEEDADAQVRQGECSGPG